MRTSTAFLDSPIVFEIADQLPGYRQILRVAGEIAVEQGHGFHLLSVTSEEDGRQNPCTQRLRRLLPIADGPLSHIEILNRQPKLGQARPERGVSWFFFKDATNQFDLRMDVFIPVRQRQLLAKREPGSCVTDGDEDSKKRENPMTHLH